MLQEGGALHILQQNCAIMFREELGVKELLAARATAVERNKDHRFFEVGALPERICARAGCSSLPGG